LSRIASVFAVNRNGLNVARGLGALVVLLVVVVALNVLDQETYVLSVTFAVIFVALSDSGGDYAQRLREMAIVALGGAVLTALGVAIGGSPWGFVVLAAFAVTFLCGLAMRFGVHRFISAMLLNIWFLIAVTLRTSYDLEHVTTTAWSQTLAWLIGSAVWIALTFVVWLATGRHAEPSHFPEIPGDTSPKKLTRAVTFFALIRAVALAISVAIAFGLDTPNAYWMPAATLVAMRPSLEQSRLVAEQRLAGAIIGATVAAVFLFTIDSQPALGFVIVAFLAIAMSIRSVNYALYCSAVAAAVLIAMGLPHPTDLAGEAERVLFTFLGVGIGVVFMFLTDLLQKRAATKAT
jgi:uncharacterized membrane protein YccC